MNVVSFGGGTNSTAMIIGMYLHKIPIDLILFADTGGEQPHTYVYLEIMDRWLKSHDMPPITRVWYQEKSGQRLTLEQECLRSGTLPSIAYGRKSCSLKHKVAPQERFCNQYQPCLDTWTRGEKVVKFIGYDAGEERRRQGAVAHDLLDKNYVIYSEMQSDGRFMVKLFCAAHRLYSGNSKRRAASPRKIIVLFLPLHEAAGDPDAVSQISGSAGQSFGYRGDGNAESYLCKRIGARLGMAGFYHCGRKPNGDPRRVFR